MKIPLSLKIFLTLALLGVLFLKVDFFEIIQIFLSLNIFYLIGALFLVLVLYMIRTLRWNLFLRSFSITLPFLQSFKILLIGTFYGLVTPGKIGEVGRAYHMDEKKVLTVPHNYYGKAGRHLHIGYSVVFYYHIFFSEQPLNANRYFCMWHSDNSGNFIIN
jgi:hypothetical protein